MKTLIILIIILPVALFGQAKTEREVINSTGNAYKGDNLNLEYSVGEAISGFIECPVIKLNQGFIQAEMNEVDVVMDLPGISVKVFPNPASNWIEIFIEPKDETVNNLQVELSQLDGKVIEYFSLDNIDESMTKKIDMSSLPSGSYYLSIKNSSINKLVKIVKM